MSVVHDIFCVTYARDARWTEYMLRSITKYARGFRQTLVVCPKQDVALFEGIAAPHKNVKIIGVDEPAGVDGHMHQNALKCMADTFSDADVFHHIDSDCAVTAEWRPDMDTTDGKVDIIFDYYHDLPANFPWHGVTERALGIRVAWETMRRIPLVYPRWLYAELRAHIEERWKMPFEQYVYTAPTNPISWRGFSEFNALGAFALAKHADKFHAYQAKYHAKWTPIKQYWSHSGLTDHEREELERITEGWDK